MAAVLGGMSPRQYLSAGLAALAADAEGVPFDGSHVYASGNLAADMYANVTAEATGRALACRLYAMTDDPGMKDMLSFLIARDTMHQQQWLAVIEELGGEIDRIEIHDLEDAIFFARIIIRQNGQYVEIDSRPSDAIALGIATMVPIFVAEHVLDQVG